MDLQNLLQVLISCLTLGSHLTSFCLNFLLYKTRLKAAPTSQDCGHEDEMREEM